MVHPLTERKCARCGSAFQPPGHGRYCSGRCAAAARRSANPERARELRRRSYAAHRDATNERRRRRYAATDPSQREHVVNREKRNENQRRRRAANPDKSRAYHRAWRAANRQKRRDAARKWRKNRMLRHMPNDPFVREIVAAMFEIRSHAFRASCAHLRIDDEQSGVSARPA